MAEDTSFAEKHYRIGELAALWHIGRECLRLIFSREPGVVRICNGKKHKNCTYRIPASVAERVYERMVNGV